MPQKFFLEKDRGHRKAAFSSSIVCVATATTTAAAANELKLESARPEVVSNSHLFKSQQTEIPFLFLLRVNTVTDSDTESQNNRAHGD